MKLIVDKYGFNENIFESDMKEALQTFKLHGKIWIQKTLHGEDGKGI